MSRIGKLPIAIPKEVTITIENLSITVKGPKGELAKKFEGKISIDQRDNNIIVQPSDSTKKARAMWGTARSIINSMVRGVKDGFSEELEVNGVGYKAAVKGNYLNLALNKSHNTKVQIPSIINVETPKPNIILLSSLDKQKLGQFVANVVKERPPEPYKGKGIKRKGQYVQRKEGKKS